MLGDGIEVVNATITEKWLGGLMSPHQRRDPDLIEVFARERPRHRLGLAVAPFGERWIVDVESISNPFGLSMSDQNDLHRPTVPSATTGDL